jgi:FkbM family methyltransferase
MAATTERLRQKISKFVSKHVTHRDIHAARKRWSKLRGDQTLRLDYPLGPDSVVFDLGGYHGDFSQAIHERYGCSVYLFEPVKAYYDHCVARFRDTPRIRCFNFGLGDGNGTFHISDAGDGSSLYLDSPGQPAGTRAEIRDFHEFVLAQGVPRIDLIKINIEGGEYDVLPRMIQCGYIGKIGHLQIQFHDFIPDAPRKRDAIRHDLARTHQEAWCFKFVWESWRPRA